MTKDKKQVSDEDSALFRQSVQIDRPINHDRVTNEPKKAKKKPVQVESRSPSSQFDLPPEPIFSELDCTDKVFYTKPHLRDKQIRQLRRGQLPIQESLDLHGHTLRTAEHMLIDFLTYCQERDLRHVLIIHGKGHRSAEGRSTLKQYVNYWLRQRSEVLAFCSAQPKDGGTGAVYVWFKANFR